jgi:SAM-dependent methyltransferase
VPWTVAPGTGRKRPTLTRSGPLSIDDIRRDWAVLEANMTADAGFEHRYLEPFAWAPIFMLARGRGLGRVGLPLTVEELAAQLGTSPRAAELLVQQLHAMQLATEGPAPGEHALTPLGRRLLDPAGSTEVIGPMAAFYEDVLVRALASMVGGTTPGGSLDWPPTTTSSSRKFEDLMNATSPYVAAWLDELVDFVRVESVLDVGGGDGTVCALLCEKHPELQADVFNLPIVAPLIEETSRAHDLLARLRPVAGDFREDQLPSGYDLVLFSRMLSDWPDIVVERLLGLARDALLPGRGAVVIVETNLGPESNRSDGHAWAVFWELFVPSLPLHGPRSEDQWRELANRAGLELELLGRCGRQPFPELAGLRMSRCPSA